MKYVVMALACALAAPAMAQTYANANDADAIFDFGYPDTTSYGQVFTAPGGTLSSWTFYDTDSSDNGARLVVAAWDGSKAVGPELYSSLSQNVTAGSFFAHTYSNINLSLTAGTSYIAYLTVAGVDSPTSGNSVAGSSSSPLGGGFRYLNSGGQDPLALGDVFWNSYYVPNMQYSATFNGAVPEPASWALMLGGFGLVGGALRSRRKTAVAFGK